MLSEEHSLIQAAEGLLGYISLFFDEPASVILTNNETVLASNISPEVPFELEVGSSVDDYAELREALFTKNKIVRTMPADIYGKPLRIIVAPIVDEFEGVTVGSLVIAKNIERHAEIIAVTKQLSDKLDEMTQIVNKVSVRTDDLVEKNKAIGDDAGHSLENAKGTNEVMKLIMSVASKTNILGINALIEAARAGDAGRGFAVVAQEITYLSKAISKSADESNEIIDNIYQSVMSINGKVVETTEEYKKQLEEIEAVREVIGSLNKTSEDMLKLVAKL